MKSEDILNDYKKYNELSEEIDSLNKELEEKMEVWERASNSQA